MDLEDLIEELCKATYTDKGGKHKIIYFEAEKLAIKNIVYTWGAKQQTTIDDSKRIAELEAKCYAYEKIIANSNFAPVVFDPPGGVIAQKEVEE